MLRNKGLDPDEANELTELIRDMPASSLDHKFESLEASFTNELKVLNTTLEFQNQVLDARLRAQDKTYNTKYNTLIWLLGILTAMGLFGLFANFFNLGGAG